MYVFVRGHLLKDPSEDLPDTACCITVREIVFRSHNSFHTFAVTQDGADMAALSYKVSEIMSSRVAVMTGRDEE